MVGLVGSDQCRGQALSPLLPDETTNKQPNEKRKERTKAWLATGKENSKQGEFTLVLWIQLAIN